MTLNNNANYSTIGSERFNIAENTLADVGYMYNKRYIASSWVSSKRENISTSQNLSINYWYADSVRWNTMTNTYELVDPYKVSSTDELSSLVGKYTFHNTREDYSNSIVRYISSYVVTYNGHRAYYIAISDGHDIDYYNDVYTFGTNYINNGDGTYTIVNPQTVTKLEYSQKNYYLYQVYVCKNAVNNTCSDLWYAHIPTDSFLIYMDPKVIYRVAHGFTYSNGKYHLTDDPIDIWDFNNNATETINNHRYTCFNETGECEKVYYIYDIDWFNGNGQNNENKLYFIGIEDGKDVETAMDEMLYNDEVNTYDSVIKTSIESWYEKELLEYDNNIEDIVYCGDRSTVLGLRGWDPDGSGYGYLIFKGYRNNDELSCTNVNDQFSTSNSKAKIKYKVSLPSSQEMHLLGNSKIYNTGTSYWLMSPYAHTGKAPCNVLISSSGSITYNNNSNWNGVRPMISLKPNTIIKSGDGTKNDPYTIDLIQYYNINVIINNETEDLKVEIDDLTHVEEGETVNFKVTPIKGRKVISIRIVDENDNEIDFSTTDNKKFSFTMPASNVTIIPTYERVKNTVNVEDNINTKEFVIEVNDSTAVVYEDTVKFIIVPEEGYEVENIVITDAENNKISYKKTNNKNEYEFTMPDTDVLISPTYRKIESINVPDTLKNPNTGVNNYIIILGIIMIISTITFVILNKRKPYFKQ